MKKFCSLICCLTIIVGMLSGCSSNAVESTAAEIKDFGNSQKAVIIVLDGFSSQYLDYLGKNSNLYKIAQKGTYNLEAKTIFPSHTCGAHASIMTGCYPDKHGIIGNEYYDTKDYVSVKNIQPERIQVETLFQIAKKNGKTTAFVSGKDNMLKLLNVGCDIGISNKNYPEYVEAPPQLNDSENNEEYYKYNQKTAEWVFEALKKVIKDKTPDVVLVNIQSVDYIGHRFGPQSNELKSAVKLIDNCIGDLYSFMNKQKLLSGTSVVITADHGMSQVSKAIPLNVLIKNNFKNAAAVVDGRNGYIWLNGDSQEEMVNLLKQQEGIDKIIIKGSEDAKALRIDNAACPDIVMNSKPDYLFIPEALLSKYKGMHGTLDDTDMLVPMLWFGSGIPVNRSLKDPELVDIAPIVCKLLGLKAGTFDGKVPEVGALAEISHFTN